LLQFTFALSLITFLDRVTLGSPQRRFERPDLTKVCWAGPSAPSSLAYALFEIPSGWLGDKFGPRKSLTRIVIWWSVFCAATGVAGI
jgi:MFS family permease